MADAASSLQLANSPFAPNTAGGSDAAATSSGSGGGSSTGAAAGGGVAAAIVLALGVWSWRSFSKHGTLPCLRNRQKEDARRKLTIARQRELEEQSAEIERELGSINPVASTAGTAGAASAGAAAAAAAATAAAAAAAAAGGGGGKPTALVKLRSMKVALEREATEAAAAKNEAAAAKAEAAELKRRLAAMERSEAGPKQSWAATGTA